jgi:hypothetical protein
MSFRITAQLTVILHFPRSRKPSAHARKNGLHLMAVTAGK